MAYFQLEGIPHEKSSLESWLYRKEITQNLYNELTKGETHYSAELLLLMPQSDIRGLKDELEGVTLQEIYQLINLLKQIPQSQVYRDINNSKKEKQIIYLTPKQHNTINQLNDDLSKMCNKLEQFNKLRLNNKKECETNILLINTTFDSIFKQLNDKKMGLINSIEKIFNNNKDLLSKQESGLKLLYQTTLNVKNKYLKFTEGERDNEMKMDELVTNNKNDILKALNDLSFNSKIDISMKTNEEIQDMIENIGTIVVNQKRENNSELMNNSGSIPDFPGHLTIEQCEKLRIGSQIDHRDHVGKFLRATIVGKTGSNLKIHYDKWGRKWDCYSNFREEIDRFAVAGSISARPSYRCLNIQKGDHVAVNPKGVRKDLVGWTHGTIRRIDEKSGQVQVCYTHDNQQDSRNLLLWTHLDNDQEIAVFASKTANT